MGMIRAIRMLNGLVDGTIDGPALETLLANGRSGDFAQLLTVPSYISILANSATAVQAIIGSATASTRARTILLSFPAASVAFMASPIGGPLIVSVALAFALILAVKGVAKVAVANYFADVIANSTSQTTAFLNVAEARRAVWDSDAALIAIRDKPSAMAGAKAASGRVVTSDSLSSNSNTGMPNMSAVPRRILLNWSQGSVNGGIGFTMVSGRSDTAISGRAPDNAGGSDTSGTQMKFVFPCLSPAVGFLSGANAPVYVENLPVTA